MAKLNQKEQMLNTPALYQFNLQDVPSEHYAVMLHTLFRNEEYKAAVDKRNRLVSSYGRMRPGSSELKNLIVKIKDLDRRLADTLFSVIVQTNQESVAKEDIIPFNILLQYYVDYSKDGMPDCVRHLSHSLHKLTFLADMLDSVLIDVKDDMEYIFNGEVKFKQFDSVARVMKQLSGYFKEIQSGNDSKEKQLYLDYSDSINDYMYKRLKTYSEKLDKLRPLPSHYTADEMVEGINQFFGTDGKFGKMFIARVPSGGCYIDAIKLISNLDHHQTAKLDALVGPLDKTDDAMLRYCFQVTTVIMNAYSKQ